MLVPLRRLVAGKGLPVLSSVVVALSLLSGSVIAEEIDGTWSGVMISGGQQGSMTLSIRRQDQGYSAEYHGLPSFSGPLLSVRAGPGKVAGTTIFTAVSKSTSLSSGNYARLRFYLRKEISKPVLMGIVRMDLDIGEDMDFRVLLEQRPCCHSGCILREGCP